MTRDGGLTAIHECEKELKRCFLNLWQKEFALCRLKPYVHIKFVSS